MPASALSITAQEVVHTLMYDDAFIAPVMNSTSDNTPAMFDVGGLGTQTAQAMLESINISGGSAPFDLTPPYGSNLTDVLISCSNAAGCGTFTLMSTTLLGDISGIASMSENVFAAINGIAGVNSSGYNISVDTTFTAFRDGGMVGQVIDSTILSFTSTQPFAQTLINASPLNIGNSGVLNIEVKYTLTGALGDGDSFQLPASLGGTVGTSAVPEPGTYALFLAGLAGLALYRRKRG